MSKMKKLWVRKKNYLCNSNKYIITVKRGNVILPKVTVRINNLIQKKKKNMKIKDKNSSNCWDSVTYPINLNWRVFSLLSKLKKDLKRKKNIKFKCWLILNKLKKKLMRSWKGGKWIGLIKRKTIKKKSDLYLMLMLYN